MIDPSEQKVIPIISPGDISERLGIDPSQPFFEKRTRGCLQNNTVFEYSRNHFKSNDYKLTLIAKRY